MRIRPLRSLSGIAILLAVASYALLDGYLSAAPGQSSVPARVMRVHDGDTVSVLIGRKWEKVRLIGIDAPEMGQRPWGARAKRHLEELLDRSGGSLTLEFDVDKRDKYGRLLAYLRNKDGKMINLEMMRDGYAVLFTFPPNVNYAAELRSAQRCARGKGLGIWGEKGPREMPEVYRREHPR
ncbi:MAG: thermonuclease family protein [Nitrospirae bacterium]|nr:thermonuclease family protein [Nitrospirota bacterium]